MIGLELVVVLGVALLASGILARRWRVAPAVLLLVCGVLLGFVPALRAVDLPPAVVPRDPVLENLVILLAPFTAYLLAELVHASGVPAVVVCGLLMAHAGPRVTQAAVRGLASVDLTRGLIAVAAVSATVVGVRFRWMFTTPYIIRALDRRPQQRLRRIGARARVVSGVAGFRGAVSLAAALAIPQMVRSGQPFPGRDLIIFVTTGVIVVTLAGQALILPAVVRWARLAVDDGAARERHLADVTAGQEALSSLDELAAGLGTDPPVVDRTRHELEKRIRVREAGDGENEDEPALRHDRQYSALRLATVARKREALLRLRDQGEIDDQVLRQVQERLDLEEVRLTRREEAIG